MSRDNYGIGYKVVRYKGLKGAELLKKEGYCVLSIADIMREMVSCVDKKSVRKAWWGASGSTETTDCLVRHPNGNMKIFRDAKDLLFKTKNRKFVGSSQLFYGGAFILTQKEYDKIESEEFSTEYVDQFDADQNGVDKDDLYGYNDKKPKERDKKFITNSKLWLSLVADKKLLEKFASKMLDRKRYNKYKGESGITLSGGFPGYPTGYSYGNFAEPECSMILSINVHDLAKPKKYIIAQNFNWHGNSAGVTRGLKYSYNQFIGYKEVVAMDEQTLNKIACGKPFTYNGFKYKPI